MCMSSRSPPTSRALPAFRPTSSAARRRTCSKRMLMRGFTTVRDAGGAEWGLAEAVRLGHFWGPRLFIAGLALAQTGGQGDFRAREEIALGCPCCRATRSLCPHRRRRRRGAQGRARGTAQGRRPDQGDGGRRHGLARADPSAAFLDGRAAKPWSRRPAAADSYVMAHAYESMAIRRCVEAGCRSIEHGNLIDDADRAR